MRRIIGCMTGTSCDGIDAALVAIAGAGLTMRVRVEATRSAALGVVGDELLAFSHGAASSAADIARWRRAAAMLHAELIADWVEQADACCIHGQTVFHAAPLSWQLVDAGWLAARLGLPVLSDLRSADLAAGGQGAPITPLADLLCFGSADESRCIVNLGGFCNWTRLPAGAAPADVGGGDACACNQLLDGLARRLLDRPYDVDGAVASTGHPRSALVTAFQTHLAAQAAGGRSLGSGDELTGDEAFATILPPTGAVPAADILASAAAAIARVIAGFTSSERVVLAGGGCLNRRLVAEIAQACAGPVTTTQTYGIAPAYREAVAMAVLAACCLDGLPITLSAVTGVPAPAPLAGSWTPGPPPVITVTRPGSGARQLGDTDRDIEQTLPSSLSTTVTDVGSAEQPVGQVSLINTSTGPDHSLTPDRGAIATEARHPFSHDLHALDTAGCLARFARIDAEVLPAVTAAHPALAAFIDDLLPGFCRGGRLIYLGAGTSGRLGVLDASEAPPTFDLPPDRLIGLIAGGDCSLRRSSEGREDEPDGAIADLQALALGPDDAVLGIAAGGTTPWVRGALGWAAALPQSPVTGLLSCSPIEAPLGCRHLIIADTGAELLTGSTRLKAGTATKLLLNGLSTTLMIRSGRIYDNLMIQVRATNAKLRDRAGRIISALTGCDRSTALARLTACDGEVSRAIVEQACSAAPERAAAILTIATSPAEAIRLALASPGAERPS